MDTIRIAGVVRQSIVDGPGLRLAVFVQGCPHHCPGCHNPDSWDFEGGYDCEVGKILRELDKNPLLQGITLSGGEPISRAAELLPLLQEARKRGRDVVCFTGYTFEELLEMDDPAVKPLLEMVDLLIDGPYVQALRDLSLRFRGSSNQRVLDMKRSLASGRPVWAEGYRAGETDRIAE